MSAAVVESVVFMAGSLKVDVLCVGTSGAAGILSCMYRSAVTLTVAARYESNRGWRRPL